MLVEPGVESNPSSHAFPHVITRHQPSQVSLAQCVYWNLARKSKHEMYKFTTYAVSNGHVPYFGTHARKIPLNKQQSIQVKLLYCRLVSSTKIRLEWSLKWRACAPVFPPADLDTVGEEKAVSPLSGPEQIFHGSPAFVLVTRPIAEKYRATVVVADANTALRHLCDFCCIVC